MKLEVRVPQLVQVDDYHDFRDIYRSIALLNPELDVIELGHNGEMYVGVICLKEPTPDELEELSERQDISIDFPTRYNDGW